MRTKKTNKKSKFLFHRIAKFHIKALSFLLILYLVLGAAIDPRFLAYDFRQKYSAIAASSDISVSLRVMGQPEKPIVTAEAGWINGVSFIQLDWNQTEDTENYDIHRDSLPLITGLTTNSYRDTNIQKNTFYSYKVLARGPLGETFSDEIHIFSGDHEIYELPECQITTIEGLTFTNLIKITNRTPNFAGTTNIENALITIEIGGAESLTATTTANSNGYWSWLAPEKLTYGTYSISVTAIDPENSLTSAQISKSFEIIKEKEIEQESEETSKETSKKTSTAPTIPLPIKITPTEKPIEKPTILEKGHFALIVSVANSDQSIYTNDYLRINTQIITTDPRLGDKKIKLHYTIADEKNNSILDFSEDSVLPENKIIQKKVYISDLFPAGKYKIMVRTNDRDALIYGEAFFQVKEYDLISIGGTTITLSQFMQSLSWIIIFLAILILFFLLMLAMEKYLASQAKIQITEHLLAKKGYFGKRKGVQR